MPSARAKDQPAILPRIEARTKLSNEIVGPIRQAILAGKYAAGEHLRLEFLAQQLGTSIMPVREALIGLAGEGLVAVLPRRGFVATPPDEQDWEDLFDLQGYLAGILTRRAVIAATDEDIARLKAIQAEIAELSKGRLTAETARAVTVLNTAFHQHINKIPKGSRARWFLRITTRFTHNTESKAVPGWVEVMLRDHQQIIAAFEARNAPLAGAVMERHFAEGSRMIAAQFVPLPASGKRTAEPKAQPKPKAVAARAKPASARMTAQKPSESQRRRSGAV